MKMPIAINEQVLLVVYMLMGGAFIFGGIQLYMGGQVWVGFLLLIMGFLPFALEFIRLFKNGEGQDEQE